MSEEVIEGTESVVTQEGGEVSQPSTNELLGAPARSESPFDALFAEGALDKLPPEMSGLKNWIGLQKNGVGMEKGLQGLQKLASSKGFERPADDAPEEAKAAFQEKLRELQGVPQSAEDYSFEMPEGFNLPDELATQVKEFGVKEGIPPSHIEKLLPFQVELEKASQKLVMEEHIAAQMEHGDKLFGGEGEFDKQAPALAQYAEKRGFDVKNDPAFRNATTYKLLADLKNLTGEDTSVRGETQGVDAAKTQLQQFMEKNGAALRDRRSPNLVELNQEYLRLTKAASGR